MGSDKKWARQRKELVEVVCTLGRRMSPSQISGCRGHGFGHRVPSHSFCCGVNVSYRRVTTAFPEASFANEFNCIKVTAHDLIRMKCFLHRVRFALL